LAFAPAFFWIFQLSLLRNVNCIILSLTEAGYLEGTSWKIETQVANDKELIFVPRGSISFKSEQLPPKINGRKFSIFIKFPSFFRKAERKNWFPFIARESHEFNQVLLSFN